VVSLDPPSIVTSHEYFHHLRLHDAIGTNDDPAGHGPHAPHFVIDIDNRNIGRNESNAADGVMLGGALVKRGEDLGMPLSNAAAPYMTIPKRLVNDTPGATWRA
jgi:hypothetical protein